MQFCPLATTTGQDACLLLGPVGAFPATIPFEPSVFGGNGGEPRKAIRFATTEQETLLCVRDVEHQAQALLGNTGTRFTWNSAITEATEFHPASIKAKIWTTGERAATVRNERGEAITLPGQPWPRPGANAAVEVRGVYRQTNGGAGPILQVVALQLAGSNEQHQEEDPYA